MQKVRNVVKRIYGIATQDGAGVKLTRVIGHDTVHEADPFLMLDAFDSTNPDDYIKGFPWHPHRGIETVTYLIKGEIDHGDSLGNKGVINSGQAQWMTAGSGILHQEMPQPSPHMLGFQLWINLPRNEKMVPPHYYDITENMIKTIDCPWGTIRVIAGEYEGHHGATPKYATAHMFDITVHPGKTFTLPVDEGDTALAYVIEGSGFFGAQETGAVGHKTAVLLGEGNRVEATAEEELRFMLFVGTPLNEPIAWGGPIVMNTQEELRQAFAELEQGTFIR